MRKGKVFIALFLIACCTNVLVSTLEGQNVSKNSEEHYSINGFLSQETNVDSENLAKLGEWDQNIGQMQNIVLSDDFAFIACEDGGLQIISLKYPEEPFHESSFEEGFFVADVFVREDLAFLCCMHELIILDVSNPQAIIIIGQASFSGGGTAIDVVGDYAYLCVNFNGVLIFDISDATNPSQVGFFLGASDYFEDIFVHNGLAFICYDDIGLDIVDVSIPSNPQFKTNFAPSNFFYDFILVDNIGFIAGYDQGVHFVNLSDPLNPSLILTYVDPGPVVDHPVSLTVQNDILFIVNSGNIHQVDISNVSNPQKLADYDAGRSANDFALRDSLGYLLVVDNGLFVVDYSDSNDPSKIFQIPNGGEATDVWVTGDVAVVNNEWGGLSFVDISDPSSPEKLSSLSGFPVTVPHAVTGNGSLVLVANGDGLLLVNISDVHDPKIIGSKNGIGVSRDIAFYNDLVFLASGYDGLAIIDISIPSFPVIKSIVNIGDFVRGLAVKDKYVFVSTYESGIKIIDPTLSSPEVIRSVSTESKTCYDLVVFGDRMFVACSDVGIFIYDIASLSNIRKIKTITDPNQIERLHVQGDWLYATEFYGGLTVLNWHNFTCPFKIAHYNDNHHPGKPFADREIIFYADGLGGLKILQLNMTDTDNDLLPDYLESLHYNTNPSNPDTDSDSILDGVESYLGTDPLNAFDPVPQTTTLNTGEPVFLIFFIEFFGLAVFVNSFIFRRKR